VAAQVADAAGGEAMAHIVVIRMGRKRNRGVLIDIAGLKGVDVLGDPYEITVEDLEGALKKQICPCNRPMQSSSTLAGANCGQGQRALHQRASRHWCEGRRVGALEGSDPARVKQNDRSSLARDLERERLPHIG
jgi:hypothetical protein